MHQRSRMLALFVLAALLLPVAHPAGAATLCEPFWSSTGNISVARHAMSATLLPNGKVLVAGGDSPAGVQSLAELYDPVTGAFTSAGNMTKARKSHTATLVSGGAKLLITGGSGDDTAEVYDPGAGSFTATGNLTTDRIFHTATLLPNGKVLVVGGINGLGAISAAELYDPVAGTFTATGPLGTGRWGHTATLLPNGKVLIAGGEVTGAAATVSAELYDPATGTFSPTGSLIQARAVHTATLLSNVPSTPLSGKVLVAAGQDASTNPKNTAEIYDPVAGTFSLHPNTLINTRIGHTATLLSQGSVLLAAGVSSATTSEVFDPASGIFTSSGTMAVKRADFASVLFVAGKLEGKVLAVGAPVTPETNTGLAELFAFDRVDKDGDGIADSCDNCPTVSNAGQADDNFNDVGNACEPVTKTLTGTTSAPPGGNVVVTATFTNPTSNPMVTIRPDCVNTTFSVVEGFIEGQLLNPIIREKMYGIPNDLFTIPPGGAFSVTCDIAEMFHPTTLTTGNYVVTATYANFIVDRDFDPLTNTCNASSCVTNIWNGSVTSDDLVLQITGDPVIRTSIDIQPTDPSNRVGCEARSVQVDVAVLGNSDFDVTTIDSKTVRFGKPDSAGALDPNRSAKGVVQFVRDINQDGEPDMLLGFPVRDTGFACTDIPRGSPSATLIGVLTGTTTDGAFNASDIILLQRDNPR